MAKKLQRTMSRPQAQAKRPAGTGAPVRPKLQGRRVAAPLVTDFTIRLATLSGAGIPIVRALGILEGQTKKGPFKVILQDVVQDVSAGTPMSEAMAKHSRVFDPLFTSMVRAGEAGGVLDAILERLAQYRERAAEIRSKVVGAMIYPSVIVAVSITVIAIVIVVVIPRFEDLFESFDVTLPGTTQLLLDVSRGAVRFWYLVFGLPILIVGLHLFLMARRGYRRAVHALLLRIPLVGPVLTENATSGFARTFGTLIEAGVPHLDALSIVRDTSGNEVFLDAVEDVRVTVREGERISVPMSESGVFDDVVVSMVDVGEQTGELDGMLLKVADAYEKSLERRITNLFKVLEPLILIVMAVFVGFIVVALFVPLLKIMGTLSSL